MNEWVGSTMTLENALLFLVCVFYLDQEQQQLHTLLLLFLPLSQAADSDYLSKAI